MTYVGSLREDFFQRVINVNWDTEPECYFLAGDGDRLLNSISTGGGSVWRSDDGKTWEKILDFSTGTHDHFLTFLSQGLWMRQNFSPDGKPVWVLFGQGVSGIICPALVNSFDVQSFQQQHFPDALDGVVSEGLPHLGYFGTVQVGKATAIANVWRFLGPTGVSYSSANGVDWNKGGASAATTTAATQPTTKNKRIYQLGRQDSAFGKVREGRYKGRSLTLKVHRIDQFHFNSTIQAFDQKTGANLGASDSGIPFGCSIAYGHYVFVIIGGDGPASKGKIAWSDDGLEWHMQEMESFTMAGLAVGARK